MMRLAQQPQGIIKVFSGRYTLTLAADRPFVYLDSVSGERLAELFVFSNANPLHSRDDTTELGEWEVEQSDDEIVVSMTVKSSTWDRKTYSFRCQPKRILYEMEVAGQGQLWDVNYFGGYYSGQPRWGSGFFWSGQSFLQGFDPEPNTDELNYFNAAECTSIDLMGVPLPGKGNWFFTPPPFCFGFKGKHGWLSMGVEAQPGQNQYTTYTYHGRKAGFFLSLAYEGHTAVDGVYRLPSIGIDFAADEYEALAAHVSALQASGCSSRAAGGKKPAWWYEPIFCGWGAQSYLASMEKGSAPAFSRQHLYEQFMDTLEKQQVSPGIVVLDDKWQDTYGDNAANEEKWPDLPGFIHCQHISGRKVLLWLKAWDPEGLPAEECIVNGRGLPLAADPTNPAFEKRLRASVRRMLSPQGYNADGFKIDFTARIPSGPGIRNYGRAWGLELMKQYLSIIYTEAKLVKADALVITHTPHPYLADVLDMVRLNDINTKKDVNQAMRLRSRVAEIACPEAIIDTDNWPITDRSTWRSYLRLQPELGVPSLYYVTHIDSTREALLQQDYDLIREVWAQHRAKNDGRGGDPGEPERPALPDELRNTILTDLQNRQAMRS